MGERTIKLTVPTSWEEVTVEQYQVLQTLKKVEEYDSNLLYMIDVITSLTDVTSEMISGINLGNLNILISDMGFIQNLIPDDKKDEVKIGKDVFKWIGDLNSITVGEAISIEQIIDLEELNYTSSFDVVLAVLLRKVKEDGTLEPFDSEIFEQRRKLFSKLPITDVYGMVVFFSLGEKTSTKNTAGFLMGTMRKIYQIIQPKNWKFLKKSKKKTVSLQDGNGSE